MITPCAALSGRHSPMPATRAEGQGTAQRAVLVRLLSCYSLARGAKRHQSAPPRSCRRIACKRPCVPLAPGTHRPRQLSGSGFPGVHYCGRAYLPAKGTAPPYSARDSLPRARSLQLSGSSFPVAHYYCGRARSKQHQQHAVTHTAVL